MARRYSRSQRESALKISWRRKNFGADARASTNTAGFSSRESADADSFARDDLAELCRINLPSAGRSRRASRKVNLFLIGIIAV